MEIEEVITEYLLSQPAVTTLISRRFFFEELPQGTELPAVICIKVSDIKGHTLTGMSELERPVFQLTALAKTKAVGVLEKDVSFGAEGTVFTNVNSALQQAGATVPTFNFVGGLGGDDISDAQMVGIFGVLGEVVAGATGMPRVSFLGIDSPADEYVTEGGR